MSEAFLRMPGSVMRSGLPTNSIKSVQSSGKQRAMDDNCFVSGLVSTDIVQFHVRHHSHES